jgi:hypothetical protein
MDTSVSDERDASIFKAHPEDGGMTAAQNDGYQFCMGELLISTVHGVCLFAVAGLEENSCVVDSVLLCSQLTSATSHLV